MLHISVKPESVIAFVHQEKMPTEFISGIPKIAVHALETEETDS